MAVIGKHIDDLDAEKSPAMRVRRRPGRHQQMGGLGAARAGNRVMMARRRGRAAAEGLRQRLDQRGKVERRIDFGGRDQSHRPPFPIRRDAAG